MRFLIISILLSLLIFSNSYAAPKYCPTSLSCNYDTGECKGAGGWMLYVANDKPFTGWKDFALTKIYASKRTNGSYHFECDYLQDNDSAGFELYDNNIYQLIGQNWTYSGFGKQKADCTTITDPTTCGGE